ncbi:MAG: hypothetical protein KC561_03645, partial [Myxococcales bacterium]|nr:hypothetical protein [Myxococcales bacterium]
MKRILAITTLLLCPLPAAALDGLEPHVNWGLNVGVQGQMPVGSDVSQSGQTDDEFGAGLAIQVEPFATDIGFHWQLVPFVLATVAGGPNADVYEAAVADQSALAGEAETNLLRAGLGTRYFPTGLTAVRP